MGVQIATQTHCRRPGRYARPGLMYLSLLMTLLVPVLAVACANPGSPTPTPQSRVDATMNSYLQELRGLSDALTEFGNPDGTGDPLPEVREAATRLIGYTPFFASLTQERLDYINERYGAELGALLQQIASRVVGAVEISGEAEIVQLVQQIPGFAPTSSESSR